MGETEISWTHRPGTVGRTWNPTQGCSRISTGCEHCYAERMAARFAADGWSQGLINLKTRKWNGEVRLAAHKLADPLKWRAPSTVFVNSMSDLFHEKLTNEQIAAVFGVMAAAPQHTFQCLTKRAKRMREWFEWVEAQAGCTSGRLAFLLGKAVDVLPEVPPAPRGDMHGPRGTTWPLPNVWLGVSVEDQAAADERIPELLATPAAVRFLSCEPLLGPVDLHAIQIPDAREGLRFSALQRQHDDRFGQSDTVIDWVIVGCESGPGARRCEVEWLRSLRDQCAAARVPFFLKQAVESDMGKCGDADNPNGDRPCGERIRYYVQGPKDSSVSCGCTAEGAEDANGCPPVGEGEGSKRKGGGVIELPYLDGIQHAAFPEVRS